MAAAPTIAEAGSEPGNTRISMLDALAAPNMVPLLGESDVNKIGHDALSEFETDLGSLDEFYKRYDSAMDMALQKRKDKTFPWPGASNVIFPLLTQAAIQFQARAYPAIIDGTDVVKAVVLGPDPEGRKRNRADRVAAHMTWQFLHDIPGWEEDTDKLLLQLPIIGCVFRKTWHDPLMGRCSSETISARDFVVNYKTTSFDKAPRFTHIQRYYPHEIEAFVRSGQWSAVHYEGDDGSDPHSLVEILEQHRLIDMDGDGLPEPYVVTLTRDGAVARIVACYDADGIFVMSAATSRQVPLSELMQAAQQQPEVLTDLKVIRIERREYFTKYGFIPAPDGSFYDLGFGTLTENLCRAVNTIINQLVDAGTLANMQGGFLGGGTKIRGGNMRFTPGEWKRVEGVTAGPLRDNILPLALPGPSAVLFELLGMLVEAVQNITSVSDILTGNQDTQTAPTTALALIEQGQKVFTAIYQRIHRTFGQDVRILFGLNRDYLDEQVYFNLNDQAGEAGRADYESRDLDVMPVSDPRAINDRVKMAKAEALMAHNGDPLFNQVEIRKRELAALGIESPETLLVDPATLPPPPEAVIEEKKLAIESDRAQAEIRSKDAATANSLIDGAVKMLGLGSALGEAEIAIAQDMLAKGIALADAVSQAMEAGNGGQPADGPGAVPGMEGAPVDGGVPPVPQGLSGLDGSAVGGGGSPVGGPAIAGLDAQRPGPAGV